jgi:hypothetical protein
LGRYDAQKLMITKLVRAELAMIMAVWLREQPYRHDQARAATRAGKEETSAVSPATRRYLNTP